MLPDVLCDVSDEPVATGTATFVGNDDIAACVDILHWRLAGEYLYSLLASSFSQASVRVDTHWWLCSVNACRSVSSSRDLVTPSVQHVKLLNVALLSRPPSSWKSVRGAGRCVGVSRGGVGLRSLCQVAYLTKAMCLESDASVKSIDAVLGKVPLPCLWSPNCHLHLVRIFLLFCRSSGVLTLKASFSVRYDLDED